MTGVGFRRVEWETQRRSLRRVSEMKVIATEEYPGRIECLVSLADGRRVIALNDMGFLMLCDVEAGVELSRSPDHEEMDYPIAVAALSAGRAISVRHDAIEVWRAHDLSSPLQTIVRATPGMAAIAAHPDGRRFALLDESSLEIWNLESGECTARVDITSQARHLVGDEARLFTSGDDTDRDIEVWSWDATPIHRLREGMRPVAHRDGRLFVIQHGGVEVWSPPFREPQLRCDPDRACESVALLDDGRAVTASFDGELVLWELEAGTAVAAHQGVDRGDHRVVAMSADRFAVARGSGPTLELWEVVPTASHAEASTKLGFADLDPLGDAAVIAHARSGGSVVIDLASGARRGPLLPRGHRHHGAILYADERVALINDAWYLTLFERATGERLAQARDNHFDIHFDVPGGRRPLEAVAREGTLVAGWLYDHHHVELIDLRLPDGERQRRLGPHAAAISAIAFADAAGEHLLVACADRTVSVWRTADATRVALLACGPCRRLLTGDGWFATHDAEHRVHTFDRTGAALATLDGSHETVIATRELVTASDGVITSWDPRTGAALATWHAGHPTRSLIATRAGHVAWLDPHGEVQIITREPGEQHQARAD